MSADRYKVSRAVRRIDESGIPEKVVLDDRDEVVIEGGLVVSSGRARMLGLELSRVCEVFDEDLMEGLGDDREDGRITMPSTYVIAHINPGGRGRPLG